MQSKQRFQNNYDFLRVFAALCITFFHSFVLINRTSQEPLVMLSGGRINFSFVALNIFFCISGYLIAKSATSSPTLKNYLWKRLLRIQPLLIVVCILTVFFLGPSFTHLTVLNYFLNTHTWSYFRNILPVFGLQFTLPGVFMNNLGDHGVNGSLWTLIVEERLYLLMCFVFLFKKQNSRYIVFYIFFLNAIYLYNRFYYAGDLIPYFNRAAFYYSLVFLNSAALFIMKANFSKNLYLFISISSILVLSAILFEKFDFIYIFSFPVLVNSVAQIKGFTNYAGKYGDFTYGIYVFSFPVQQMLIAEGIAFENPYLLFILTLGIVFPLAVLSWNLIEKRFLRAKKWVK